MENLTIEEAAIYWVIANSKNAGIWVRTVRQKVLVDERVFWKAIKRLEKRKVIKRRQNEQTNVYKKIYVLYEFGS